MKIGMQTWGSDGDILPFFALANGLRTAGHDVTICYTSVDKTDYSALAKKLDIKSINVFPTPQNDIHAIGKEVTKTPNLLKQWLLVSRKFFEPALEEMYEASQHLCRNNDIVVSHFIQNTLYTAAEKYHIPRVSVCYLPPSIPSRCYPPLGAPDLGSLMNSLQHVLADTIGARLVFPSLNKLQSREGLSSVKRYSKQITVSKDLTLVAVSPSLFPRKPDWDNSIQVCGFLNIPINEAVWNVPPQLLEFIRADTPPIYMTFGSMDHYQPESNLRLLIDSIKLSKQRAIIQTTVNRASQSIDDPNVFIVNRVPYHAIFSLCSVVVHHGGVGTIQSSLLAGIPSVVVEHAFDQTFWAQQLRNVGVTENVLHRRSVTPRKLADAIHAIMSCPKYTANAQKLSAMMKKENGVKKAVQLIEETFQMR
ncbi:MAG: glycosyltransferase [Nitrospira sp.]|nr:glycosyltransferase [Nitrospira sp.]